MNTTENNKLIAEFMALDKGKFEILLADYGWFDSRLGRCIDGKKHFSDFKYHTSWDWLMTVVIKISKIEDETLIETIDRLDDYLEDYVINSKEDIYKAVVEFIKWYNENK